MKARKTWILIADGLTARILENTGRGKGLKAVAGKDWHAPEKGAYESKQGTTNSSVGRSKHRMAPHNAPDKQEADFAKDLAKRLSLALADGEFDDLILSAAPHMLGNLRSALDAQLRATVIAEQPKDLVKTPDADLEGHFADLLQL